jgi:carnitine O-acetyltransferase
LESAAFLLCLDDATPSSPDELAFSMLNSTKNRFFDKPLQIVMFPQGTIGLLAEHSLVDGAVTARFLHTVYEDMARCKVSDYAEAASSLEARESKSAQRLTTMRYDELRFVGPSSMIDSTKLFLDDMLENKDCSVVSTSFGSEEIKTKFKVSPDAFAQMVIQLAGRQVFGEYVAAYESTQTRTYQHGRTEVTRSTSPESVIFCETVILGSAKSQSRAALIRACQAHVEFVAKASRGAGVDRHLMGLAMSLVPEETCELFQDPLFLRSKRWCLSTSSISYESMQGWGFGEVVSEGVGIGYSTLKNTIRFSVHSGRKRERFSEKLGQALIRAATVMRQLFYDDVLNV